MSDRQFQRGGIVTFKGLDAQYEVLGVRKSDGYVCCIEIGDPEFRVSYVRADQLHFQEQKGSYG